MENTEKVTITLDEYSELFESQIKYDALINAIFDNNDLRLNYNGDDLRIEDIDLRPLLKVFESTRYKNILNKLIDKEAKNNVTTSK